MKFIVFSLLVVSCSSVCLSQTWQTAIGLSNGDEESNCIIRMTNGGYISCGATSSSGAGSSDMYLFRLDAGGNLQWTKTLGGTGYDRLYSIVATSDGGYAVTGWTRSYSNWAFYLAKLDTTGSVQWNKVIDQSGTTPIAYSVIQTADGSIVMAGDNSASHMHILKYSASGVYQWNREVEGINNQLEEQQRMQIKQTPDGGFAIASSTNSWGAGGYDMYLVRLDSSGFLQWAKTVGGPGFDNGYSLAISTDGGYVIAGATSSFGAGSTDMYIVKLNSSGNLQWTKTIGGTGTDVAYSIIATLDGGFAACGYTSSFGAGGSDVYVVKLDSAGALQWNRTIGVSGGQFGFSIIQNPDGSYVVSGRGNNIGSSSYDAYVVKLDANGNACGNSTTPSSISGTGGTLTSQSPQIGSQVLTVLTPSPSVNSGGTNTISCFVGITNEENQTPTQFTLYQNFPNPFNPSTKIKFDIAKPSFTKLLIYDILGSEVASLVNEYLQPGTFEVEFNGTNISSGIYFYSLESSDFVDTKKMIIIK